MSHCNHYSPAPSSRRHFLAQTACGFGGVALAALAHDPAYGAAAVDAGSLAARVPMHRAAAKNVIFLYMDGGPSQMDLFDPKPTAAKRVGRQK